MTGTDSNRQGNRRESQALAKVTPHTLAHGHLSATESPGTMASVLGASCLSVLLGTTHVVRCWPPRVSQALC